MSTDPLRHVGPAHTSSPVLVSASVTSDWRLRLPALTGDQVLLRPLRPPDARSLFAMLTAEVTRFISPPPTTVAGFERFIEWTHREQRLGTYVCFAVVPHGLTSAIGLFQLRAMQPDFSIAEWGFALGSAFWGTGMFVDAAQLAVDFALGTLGVHRLEARAAVQNGRGNAALRKIGAVQEGLLRSSLLRHGCYVDQILWTILADEWRARSLTRVGTIRTS